MSANVSEPIANELVAFAERHGVKLSPIIDLALRKFFAMEPGEQERALARYLTDKPGKSRDAWRRSFWRVFTEEFGTVDAIDNPFAPRTFEGYVTVCLLNNVGGDGEEHEPIYVWVGPQVATETRNESRQFQFARQSSPAAAAEAVSNWVKKMAARDAQ